MAPDPVTQARIYEAVKEDYLAGLLRPGVRIEIQTLADRHRASTTPVREVLHKLEGERLLEPRPEGGFRIAIPDASRLLHIYVWNLNVLLCAIRLSSANVLREAIRPFRYLETATDPIVTATQTATLFTAICGASANAEFVDQIVSANERLHYVRIAEAQLFADANLELRRITLNGTIDVKRALGGRLKRYHGQRARRCAEIRALTLTKSPERWSVHPD